MYLLIQNSDIFAIISRLFTPFSKLESLFSNREFSTRKQLTIWFLE